MSRRGKQTGGLKSPGASNLLPLLGRLAMIACLIVSGCHSPFAFWHSRRDASPVSLAASAPRVRLVVVPIANSSRYPEATAIVLSALQSELQAAGRFEVQLADLALFGPNPQLPPDAYVRALPDVIRTQQPDVILLCNVTEFHPYPPMTLGLQLSLVSPSTAGTVAAIDSVWEAPSEIYGGRPMELPIISDVSPYAMDAGAVAHSPRLFVRSVAAEIAASLSSAMPPHLPIGSGAAPASTQESPTPPPVEPAPSPVEPTPTDPGDPATPFLPPAPISRQLPASRPLFE